MLGGKLGEDPTTFVDWRGRGLRVGGQCPRGLGGAQRRFAGTGVSSEVRAAEQPEDERDSRPRIDSDGAIVPAGDEAEPSTPLPPPREAPALADAPLGLSAAAPSGPHGIARARGGRGVGAQRAAAGGGPVTSAKTDRSLP
ncbi:unnamed protein product [Prorocentrum cordatum]|uniref:Uncharacterized protein n=1 Tax=Prorocentrum cordatum TaxID=2364126 RepID=A0ABN9VBX8_9DINO|nr:unnamed protein product [Polarella glacialis]